MTSRKKTLLIGGDSFAVSPEWEYRLPQQEYHLRDNLTRQSVKHWCEQWADEKKMDNICAGIPGGDNSTNTSILMREMWTNTNITHCVFFVTNPFRTNVRHIPEHEEVVSASRKEEMYVERMVDYDDKWIGDLDSYYSVIPYHDGEKSDFPGSHYTSLNTGYYMDLNHLWHRMDRIPEHDFIQKSLNTFSGLASVADHLGIKLLFTTGFGPGDKCWRDWIKVVLKLPVWDFIPPTKSDPDCFSHHTNAEHASILKYMKEHHSETYDWLV